MLHAKISLVVDTAVVAVEAPAAARHVKCILRRVRAVEMKRVYPFSHAETSQSTVAIVTSPEGQAAVVQVTVDRAGSRYERCEGKPWRLV